MKRSLVIGGTRGIGRAVARVLAKEGHRVTVIGRRKPDSPQHGVRYHTVDLADHARLTVVLHQAGKLDNLVFCQRFRGTGEPWRGEFETSLTATKQIIEESRGVQSIVIIASIAGRWVANEQGPGYHVAKAGLIQLARYYAVTLGIRVNCVSPGTTVKDENKKFYLQNKRLRDLYTRITPLGRMGTAEDVANVVSFLCSEKSAFITGQNIVVDGGVSLHWPESLAREWESHR